MGTTTEYKIYCDTCAYKTWSSEKIEKCPDCTYETIEVKDTRERSTEYGECDVGPMNKTVDNYDSLNCDLQATHEADVRSLDGDLSTREICDKHARMWEPSDTVEDIRELQ